MCELALRAFHNEQGQYPKTLEELKPRYLAAVPLDPFDPRGGELRYRLSDDSYVVYSVGLNGVDEGGAAPDFNDGYVSLPETGDFRLDVMYAPNPAQVGSTNGADDQETTSVD